MKPLLGGAAGGKKRRFNSRLLPFSPLIFYHRLPSAELALKPQGTWSLEHESLYNAKQSRKHEERCREQGLNGTLG